MAGGGAGCDRPCRCRAAAGTARRCSCRPSPPVVGALRRSGPRGPHRRRTGRQPGPLFGGRACGAGAQPACDGAGGSVALGAGPGGPRARPGRARPGVGDDGQRVAPDRLGDRSLRRASRCVAGGTGPSRWRWCHPGRCPYRGGCGGGAELRAVPRLSGAGRSGADGQPLSRGDGAADCAGCDVGPARPCRCRACAGRRGPGARLDRSAAGAVRPTAQGPGRADSDG